MNKSLFLAVALALASPAAALAESGNPDQQDACRPDVRKFCYKIRPEEGDGAYLACLQQNRAKLSVKCRQVLEGFGL